MFEYISLYRKNASGQHLKVFGFTILQLIICVLIPSVLIMGAILLPMLLTLTDISGEAIGIGMALWALLIFVIWIVAVLFVITPIFIGILNYFASAYKGKDFSFGEPYRVFKSGNYSKLIKIALLVFVLYFALSLVIGVVVNMVMTVAVLPFMPLAAMLDSPGGEVMTGGFIALIIGFIILMFLIAIVAYIPYIIMYIYFAIVFMVYIDEPQTPTVDKLKIAWDVCFRSGASMVKLFFSHLILYILMTLAMFILFGGAGFASLFITESPALIAVLVITGFILTVLITLYISYLVVGSLVAYYFTGRDLLDDKNRVPESYNENFEL